MLGKIDFGFNYGKLSPNKNEVDKLKSAYPPNTKFIVVPGRDDSEAIFKVIDRKLNTEIQSMLLAGEKDKNITKELVDTRIFDACLVWPNLPPEVKLQMPIGTVPSVVRIISEKSGFINVDLAGRPLGPDQFTISLKEDEGWDDPEDEEINSLKAKYNCGLYKLVIGDYIFIIRPMSRIDLNIMRENSDPEFTLVKSTLVWPKDVDWETLPAGYVQRIAETAFNIAGYEADIECYEI